MDYKQFRATYKYSPKTLLGRGAFGSVYLAALDGNSKKRFAVKEVHVSAQSKSRFSLSDEVIRSKKIRKHPNIIHYEAEYTFPLRKANATLFCAVMPYMSGGDLRHLLDNYTLDFEEKKALADGIIRGLNHLHGSGAIHAGLAPANILIEQKGQKWIPRISHFGLSHISDKPPLLYSDYTHNIEYCAPEQVLDESLTYAVDLWSLGIVLFELFTEKKLFSSQYDKTSHTADYRKDIFKKIISVSFSIDDLSQIPEPYQAIIYYCLQRNPARRIRNVSKVLNMIREFDTGSGSVTPYRNQIRTYIREYMLESSKINTYELTPENINLTAARKKFKINRSSGLIVLSLFVLSALAVWGYFYVFHGDPSLNSDTKNDDVKIASDNILASGEFLEKTNDITVVNNSDEDGISGGYQETTSVAESFPDAEDIAEPTATEPQSAPAPVVVPEKKAPPYLPERYALFDIIKAHDGKVYKIRKLTTHSDKVVTVGWDGKIKVWDISDKKLKPVQVDVGIDKAFSIAVSPDNKKLVTGSWKDITIWSLPDLKKIKVLKGHTDDVESLSFSTNGKNLLSGSWDHSIKVWDVEKGIEIKTLNVHGNHIEGVAYHPKNNLIASLGKDNKVYLIDPDKKEVQSTLNIKSAGASLPSLSSDKKPSITITETMDVASGDKKRQDTPSAKLSTAEYSQRSLRDEFQPPLNYKDKVRSIAFDPSGSVIAISKYNTVQIWDTETGTLLRKLSGHKGIIHSISFHPREKYILTGGDDKTIKIWNYTDGTLVKTLLGHKNPTLSLSFDHNGEKIISGSSKNNIRIWKMKKLPKKKKSQGKKPPKKK